MSIEHGDMGDQYVSDLQVDELATAIVKKLAGNLYRMPDVFWQHVMPGTFVTVPVTIPCKSNPEGKDSSYYYIFRIMIRAEDRTMTFQLLDPWNLLVKEFAFT